MASLLFSIFFFYETKEQEPTHEINKLRVNRMYLSSKNNMQDIFEVCIFPNAFALCHGNLKRPDEAYNYTTTGDFSCREPPGMSFIKFIGKASPAVHLALHCSFPSLCVPIMGDSFSSAPRIRHKVPDRLIGKTMEKSAWKN